MLRNALLWASTNPTLAEKLPRVGFVRRATRRFMPGEELSDALAAAAALGEDGIGSTITLLGENLTSRAEADDVLEHYRGALATIAERGLDCEISVKPTQIGIDFGVDEASERLDALCDATGAIVWIDMEGSAYVERTLELFRAVRGRRDNVGLCLQAYLQRTQADLDALLPLDPAIRVVKGAYNEPETVALASKADVDRNFVVLTQKLLRARHNGGSGRPVVATHDPRALGEANRIAYELGLAKDRYEIAMLYGIRTTEQKRLAATGHRVRVLISYGSAWFPWYMRRLAERPANLWFVVKQLVG